MTVPALPAADPYAWVAIWIRLPQVSSRTAVVTGPISRGSWVKRTPWPRRRSYSALDVVDGELGERDAVRDEGVPVGPGGRVPEGLQEQLRTVGALGRDDGQPPVRLPHGDVVLLHESEDLGVEAQRGCLVVDEDAGQMDFHGVLSFGGDGSGSSVGQRSAMCLSGAVFRSWNLYRPSRLTSTRPAPSSTARCWETAWREMPR